MKTGSIYPIAQALIEDSECYQLLQQYPYAGSHDGTNYVFVSSVDNPINATILPELSDEITIDDIVLIAGGHLANPEYTGGLIGSHAILDQLYRTPVYKLFCGRYEDSQALADDALEALGLTLDARQAVETLTIEVRAAITSNFGY